MQLTLFPSNQLISFENNQMSIVMIQMSNTIQQEHQISTPSSDKSNSQSQSTQSHSNPQNIIIQTIRKERIQSIDIYRGFALFGMIFVHHAGSIEDSLWWLTDPYWNGFTFTTLILPAFLFIMGMVIPISIQPNRPISSKNFKRVIYLFCIGAIINLIEQKFTIQEWRIPGILQTLGICYGIIMFIHWITDYGNNFNKKIIGGMVMILLVILNALWMLNWENPQMDCLKPTFKPQCNFARYIDLQVFTQQHMLLPTEFCGVTQHINKSFTTYCGYLFGLLLIKFHKNRQQKIVRFGFGFALACIILVFPLSLIFPINKTLYTVSFLFLALATSSTSFTIFYFVFDFIPTRGGERQQCLNTMVRPLIQLGRNSLAIYMTFLWVSIIFRSYVKIGDIDLHTYLYAKILSPLMAPQLGSIIYGFLFSFFYIILGKALYLKKIFATL